MFIHYLPEWWSEYMALYARLFNSANAFSFLQFFSKQIVLAMWSVSPPHGVIFQWRWGWCHDLAGTAMLNGVLTVVAASANECWCSLLGMCDNTKPTSHQHQENLKILQLIEAVRSHRKWQCWWHYYDLHLGLLPVPLALSFGLTCGVALLVSL